ncbi:MAG: methionine--tRNA ligase subunit beta [Candidatus Omnitrophota bacterium]|nr:methionine--tRNA ligase subunit beta [Candidatus Omnitrophota bacterium]
MSLSGDYAIIYFMVTFEEFKRLEIKIAQIKSVRDHPNADKLYCLTIDVGGIEKQIVAGIKLSYQPADLIGKKIVVINNLDPAIIRGEKSEAMLLAASDIRGISVLIPERDCEIGSIVK